MTTAADGLTALPSPATLVHPPQQVYRHHHIRTGADTLDIQGVVTNTVCKMGAATASSSERISRLLQVPTPFTAVQVRIL